MKNYLAKIDTIIKIVGLGRAARDKKNIRIRQPLSKLYIKVGRDNEKEYLNDLKDQILEELNIKELEIVDSVDKFLNYEVKPNFSILGKRLGKDVQKVAIGLMQLNSDDLVKKIRSGKNIIVDGIKLAPNEMIININEKEIIQQLKIMNILQLLRQQ